MGPTVPLDKEQDHGWNVTGGRRPDRCLHAAVPAALPDRERRGSIEEFAKLLGWPVEVTRTVALALDERGLIETDRGLGTEVAVIEGRSGT
jgi:hypothetical protein